MQAASQIDIEDGRGTAISCGGRKRNSSFFFDPAHFPVCVPPVQILKFTSMYVMPKTLDSKEYGNNYLGTVLLLEIWLS